jgi:non-ribosomal peptide synthetase component F
MLESTPSILTRPSLVIPYIDSVCSAPLRPRRPPALAPRAAVVAVELAAAAAAAAVAAVRGAHHAAARLHLRARRLAHLVTSNQGLSGTCCNEVCTGAGRYICSQAAAAYARALRRVTYAEGICTTD